MADGTSVGKISLDIELGGNIKEQIKKAAGEVGKGIEDTLSGQNLDMTGITKGVEKALSGMEMAFRASFDDIRTMSSDLAQYIRDTLSSVGSLSLQGPKSIDMPSTATVNPSAMATGPPAVRIKTPTVGPDVGAIKMQMQQLDTVLSGLDQKADAVRVKMAALKTQIDAMSKPSGNAVQDFINTDGLPKARAELAALEAEHEKIGTKVTAINDKYIKLENTITAIKGPVAGAAQATAGVATAAAKIKPPIIAAAAAATGLKISLAGAVAPAVAIGSTIKRFSAGAVHSVSSAMSGLKARVIGVGASMRNMVSGSLSGLQSMARSLIRTARSILILGIIAAGMRSAFGIFAYGANQTAGFQSALLNLKTALYTALYPIYTAVMPALIRFMQGLAMVINYLAVFISMLTGSTYAASYKGAQALQMGAAAAKHQAEATAGASKALDTAGASSKKMAADVKKSAAEAKRALAGFDELNILSFPKDPSENLPAIPKAVADPMAGFVPPEMGAPFAGLPGAVAMVTPVLQGLKDLFSTIFDPLKSAWDKQGPVFLSALSDAIDRTKAIFGDLYEVLKSPPVQDFMQKMGEIGILLGAVGLRIYADFIGPLIQWFVNSLPKAAEAFNPVLDKIIERLEALAAPGFGSTALANIIPALNRFRDALLPFTVTLADGLIWIYDNVLVPLATFVFTDVVPRLLDLLTGALIILNNAAIVLQPLWQWLWDNLFAPIAAWTGGVILTVLDGINAALKVVGDWILANKQTIENIIITVGAFAIAWGLVNAAITIWNVVASAGTIITGALAVASWGLGAAIAFITSPIGIAVIVIGTLIAAGVLLWKNWDTVKANATALWNKIKEVFNGMKTAVSEKLTAMREKIREIFENIKKSITDKVNAWNAKVKEVVDKINAAVEEKFQAMKTKIKEIFEGIKTAITEKVNAWNTKVTEIVGKINLAVEEKFQAMKTKIGEIFQAIKDTISEKITAAKDTVSDIIDKIKGFFDFKFTWPTMPMPHFGIEPDGWKIGDLLKGSIPKLGINWYAKGGEFDQPSVIGVGENGREAVVPLEHNTSWAKDVANLIMGGMGSSGGSSGGDQTIKMVIDEREVGRAILRDWNRAERQSGRPTTLKR